MLHKPIKYLTLPHLTLLYCTVKSIPQSNQINQNQIQNTRNRADQATLPYRTYPTPPSYATLRSLHTHVCGGNRKSMKPCGKNDGRVPDEEGERGEKAYLAAYLKKQRCLGVCGAGGTKVPSFGFGLVWLGEEGPKGWHATCRAVRRERVDDAVMVKPRYRG